MNIIFLDFDGVINPGSAFGLIHNTPFDQQCINNIKKLCDITESKILVMSNWRKVFPKEKIENIMIELGLREYTHDDIIVDVGNTVDKPISKSWAVHKWLSENEYGTFIIIDDQDIFEKVKDDSPAKKLETHLYRPKNPEIGFQEYEIKKAIMRA
jgi:hypothetical protein